jgi:hypothetical protein
LYYNTKNGRDVDSLPLFTISLHRLQSIYIYKKRLKTKKAETFASTFDMIAYDHRKSNKRIDVELSETHNLVES